ncbi:histidine kinase [Geobacter sp.]|uniref:histidine kinase n=1 Tax=Geobacter sp. TaxID=46610 RepID=UPI002624850B|nr:histidine kinase [Geobacter sp.]
MKKKLLAVVAAGAVTAATAVPALALENIFHGMLREKAILSNTDAYNAGDLILQKDAKTNFYFEQRARLLYESKINDDLKGVLQFEIDSRWGDQAYGANSVSGTTYTGRNSGGGLEADRVNLETKNVYLDFRIPGTPVRTKAGIQGFTDEYKGIFLGYADTAGLVADGTFGNVAVKAGWLRFWDINEGSQVGIQSSVNTYVAGAKVTVSPKLNVGLNYYLLTDGTGGAFPATNGSATLGGPSALLAGATGLTSYGNLWLHMVGATAEANVGPVNIDGFVVGQFGKFEGATATYLGAVPKNMDVLSFAANARARTKLGPGTAKAEFLYVSGDGLNNDRYSGFITGSQYNLAGSFYVSPDMLLLLPNKYDINTSRAIAYDVNFKSQGIIGGFIGYDANLTDRVYANANAGFMAAAKLNSNSARARAGLANDSKYIGTELNAEVGYKLYDNLTASLQGAYLILGDYYKGTNRTTAGVYDGQDPDDPYTARVMLNYTF